MAKLLQPTAKYVDYIAKSKHYLNDPKHMYNDDLHALGRLQGYDAVLFYLKKFGHEKPTEAAKYVMEQLVTIKHPEFSKLNPNTYVDKELHELPLYVQNAHKRENERAEAMKPRWGWNEWAVGIKYDKNIYR
jgi:hypothetical protein